MLSLTTIPQLTSVPVQGLSIRWAAGLLFICHSLGLDQRPSCIEVGRWASLWNDDFYSIIILIFHSLPQFLFKEDWCSPNNCILYWHVNWHYRTPPFFVMYLNIKALLSKFTSKKSAFFFFFGNPISPLLPKLSPSLVFPLAVFPKNDSSFWVIYLFFCGIYKYLIICWWPLRFLWWEDNVVH